MTNFTNGTIFADNCERYWAKGLPVMPLKPYSPDGGPDGKPTGKEPVVLNWQSLQNRMPTETEQASWKIFHRAGNLGLPLGPQSGLVAIDIDSDDPKVLGVIDQVLPLSPWRRVGQKGKVLVYRYEGQPIIRIRHKQDDGKMGTLIEMLSAGSQIVLPPSIHPKTGREYYANCELLDVLDQIPALPKNIEAVLRDALTRAGFQLGSGNGYGALTEYVSAGGRDNALTAVAGICARDVTRGQRTLLEAMQHIEVHAATYLQKTYGDNIDPEKGPKKLLEFLFRDVTGSKKLSLPRGWDDGLTDDQRKSWGVDRFTEDHEGWDGKRIADYIVANVDKAGVKTDYGAFMDFANDVLGRIASNSKLPAIEEDGLIQDLVKVSGKRLTVAAARRQVAEMRRGPITGVSHAEVAQLVLNDLQELGGEIRFDNEILWQWQGDHWKRMDEGAIVKHIAEEYGECKAATRASDHQGILRTLRYMAKNALIRTNERGINFVNGYLTEDLTLKPHNPDFGMTYVLPYAYEPTQVGKATRWQRMLFDYWGDDPDYSDKVTALGEMIALTMFGKMTSVQLAVCCYGVANSGKSRIVKVMEKLMPADSWCSLPPTMWGDKFGPAQLVGKLLNVAGELSEHQLIDGAKFKSIVSGEVVDAQFKNGQLFNFHPKAAHWFSSNFLPKSRDSSPGFTRRWMFLSFNKRIAEGGDVEEVKDYEEIVVGEEREAIVAWAVTHMARLRASNYKITDPQSCRDLRESLENELNTVRAFLVDLQAQGRMLLGVQSHTSIPDNSNFTTYPTLWTEYRSYCVSQGVAPVGSRALEKRMSQLQGTFGFRIDKVNGLTGLPIPVYRLLTLVDQRKAA